MELIANIITLAREMDLQKRKFGLTQLVFQCGWFVKAQIPLCMGSANCFYIAHLTCKWTILCFYKQGERECVHYARTGACKFGLNCKFNHPQPANGGAVASMSSTRMYALGTYPSLDPIPLSAIPPTYIMARGSYLPGLRIPTPTSYTPVILSPHWGFKVSIECFQALEVLYNVIYEMQNNFGIIRCIFWAFEHAPFCWHTYIYKHVHVTPDICKNFHFFDVAFLCSPKQDVCKHYSL